MSQAQGASSVTAPAKRSVKRFAIRIILFVAAGTALLGVRSVVSGLDDPDVGDCVQTSAGTTFEVVDCETDQAEYRIVGAEEDSMTEAEFAKNDAACQSFPTSSVVLWDPDEDTLSHGTVYCAEQL
jgi:hypothetical protein